jgi:hypothetical protein
MRSEYTALIDSRVLSERLLCLTLYFAGASGLARAGVGFVIV